MTYDVHHHRCLPDAMTVEEATHDAVKTWSREPLFHLSSPLDGHAQDMDRRHALYIYLNDFPNAWLKLDITVDVEAKAKELAVGKLGRELTNEINAQNMSSSTAQC